MVENGTFTAEKLEMAAFVLKTIAHPMRIGIVDILRDGEGKSVSEICVGLGNADQSLVSHHLANMKYKGILSSKREGRNIFYKLKLHEVLSVLECMERCELKTL